MEARLLKEMGRDISDESLRGGKGIGSRFLLVIGDDTDAATKEAAKRIADSFDGTVEARSARRRGIVLVRPDGYIAYATRSRDGVQTMTSLRSILERQTNYRASQSRTLQEH